MMLTDSKNSRSSSLTYTDCSNMSISSYLNQTVSIPALKNLTSSSGQTAKIAKPRAKVAKIKSFQSFLNLCSNFFSNLSKKTCSFFQYIDNMVSTFPQTSSFLLKKRQQPSNNLDNTAFIQHRCQKDASNLRAETAYLNNEFDHRLHTVFLHTFENIYFTFIIGRMCVPYNVNIREMEYFIYLAIATVSTSISYWLYYMPLSFLSKLFLFEI